MSDIREAKKNEIWTINWGIRKSTGLPPMKIKIQKEFNKYYIEYLHLEGPKKNTLSEIHKNSFDKFTFEKLRNAPKDSLQNEGNSKNNIHNKNGGTRRRRRNNMTRRKRN